MHAMQKKGWLILLILAISACVFGQVPAGERDAFLENYEKRITQSYLNGYYIPMDLQDALKELDRLVDEVSQKKFKSVPENEAVQRLHFSFGRWMMVNWGFYEGSRLSHFLKQKGISYPDDMASALMKCFHRSLNGVDIDFEDMAKYYRDKRKKEIEERKLQGEVLEVQKVKKKQ